MAANHIERNYLRKKGTNITTANYMAVCKCGYESDFTNIEDANLYRIDHIRQAKCSDLDVKLRQNSEDRIADDILELKSSKLR